MKFYLLIAAIVGGLFASTVPILGTDVWYSQFVAVMGFGFLILALYIGQMSISIALFFGYLIFSTIFITHQDSMSIFCLLMVGLSLLVATAITTLELWQRRIIVYVIGFLLIVQIIWGVVQYFNLDPIFRYIKDSRVCHTVGLSGSHNQYGLFLAASSIFSFMYPMVIPFVLLAIILSKTFSALLGFVVAGLFYFSNTMNKPVLIGTALVFIVVFFVISHKDSLPNKYKERTALWRLSIEQVLNGRAVMDVGPNAQRVVTCNPLFGFGFQKFFNISPATQKNIITPYRTHRYEHAHNDYVEALFDLGIIGSLLVTLVLVEVVSLFALFKGTVGLRIAFSGLIVYAVCALSIYTVHTAYSGFFLCVLLGLFYGEVKDEQKRRQSRFAQMVEGAEVFR